jgi:hypothetical protein
MLAEFVLSLIAVMVVLTGAASLFKTQWDRALCAHLAFEATHAKLTGRTQDLARTDVLISETDDRVIGEARCGSMNEKVDLFKLMRDERGVLQVPLLMALFAISIGSFGVWGVLRNWRHLTTLQFRLDRCVGEAALDLRSTLRMIDTSNREIRLIRAGIAGATLTLNAELVPPLRLALTAEVARQEFGLAQWTIRRTSWIARLSCGDLSDSPQSLPALEWIRPPPDVIGPQSLEWPGEQPDKFHLQISHSPRHAAARVNRQKGGSLGSSSWFAAWAPPRRPSFP